MSGSTLLHHSPDVFSRFHWAVTLIKKLKPGRVKIIDIGGASSFLVSYLDAHDMEYDLTIVDILPRPSDLKSTITYIQASAANVPLADNCADICVSIDTFEHLEGDKLKKQVFNEICRLAPVHIIAGPCDYSNVTTMEQDLNETNKRLFGVDQEWLAEHFICKKPRVDLLKHKDFMSHDIHVLDLRDWYVTSIANLLPYWVEYPDSIGRLNKLNTAYNKASLKGSVMVTPGNGYRTFVIGSKRGNLGKIESVFSQDSLHDTSGYVDEFLWCIGELQKFRSDHRDSDKDIAWYKSEHKRLQAEVNQQTVLAQEQAQKIQSLQKRRRFL